MKRIELSKIGDGHYSIDEKYIGELLYHEYHSKYYGYRKEIIKMKSTTVYKIIGILDDKCRNLSIADVFSIGENEKFFEISEDDDLYYIAKGLLI